MTDTHHDYSDAARHALADDLDIIAGKCGHDAQMAEGHAAHLVEQLTAARDDAAFKRSKARVATGLAAGLRHTPQPLSTEQRGDKLVKLAQQTNEHAIGEAEAAALLTVWARDGYPDSLEYLFDDLRETVHLRDGLASKQIDYRTATDATGIGAEDRALDMAQMKVDDALWPLLHGEPRCVDCVGVVAHPREALHGKTVCGEHLRVREAQVAACRDEQRSRGVASA